jgi:RNA polymerase sigma-70 factor (ECF subfamily)
MIAPTTTAPTTAPTRAPAAAERSAAASTLVGLGGGVSAIDLAISDPPRAAALDDRAVVEAVLNGDREAFRTIVERESAAIVRACTRVLGDHHEAQDAAQEAFVTAFRSLATWRGDGPLGAWLTRIAVRIALRRAAARRTVTWIDTVSDAPANVTGAAGLAPDPAILSLRAERAAAIRSEVARLDEPYRETVALRFFGERSLAEIAEETGRPLGTVKTHLHRGLQRLRAGLGERGVEP